MNELQYNQKTTKEAVTMINKEILSKVMKRAHQLAKMMVGDYVARLKLALVAAWKEVKRMLEKVADVHRFVKSNEWKNYGHHRIYFEIRLVGVEQKEINGHFVGIRRETYEKGYYDVNRQKLVFMDRHGRHMASASQEVKQWFVDEMNRLRQKALAKYGVEI